MSAQPQTTPALDWSPENRKAIDHLLTRYPTKQAVLLPALRLAQEQYGWLSTEVMDLVARTLELPNARVYGVATFYTLYKKKPTGKFCLQLCTNLSCSLRGAEELWHHLETTLKAGDGENTADMMFHLEEVECLAACDHAPVLQIDDAYHFDVDAAKIDAIVAQCRAKGK